MVVSSIGFHYNPIVIHSNNGHIKCTTSEIKDEKAAILHGVHIQITDRCRSWLTDDMNVILSNTRFLDCVDRCRSLVIIELGRNCHTHITDLPFSKPLNRR